MRGCEEPGRPTSASILLQQHRKCKRKLGGRADGLSDAALLEAVGAGWMGGVVGEVAI